MYSVNFDLEIITPLFMAGADGRTPELRPPSFKGMMRFWWRAMKAEDDIKKLANEEASILGGTGSTERKSKIQVTIPQKPKLQTEDDLLSEIGFLKNDKRITKQEYGGIGYLLYSTYTLKDKGMPVLRGYIKPDQKFDFALKAMTEEATNHALASLWLAIYLGGFGTRSRRGGGNLAVSDVQGDINKIDDIKSRFIPGGNIENFIETGFIWSRDIIQANKTETDKYSNLSRPRILLGIPHADTKWEKALNNVGDVYKKYRTDKKNELFKGPNFGMPVMHSRFKTRLIAGSQNDHLLSDRRSSPLIIKLIKFREKYFPAVIKLGGNLLPKDCVIMKQERTDRDWKSLGKSKKEDSEVVNDFLNILERGQRYREIKL